MVSDRSWNTCIPSGERSPTKAPEFVILRLLKSIHNDRSNKNFLTSNLPNSFNFFLRGSTRLSTRVRNIFGFTKLCQAFLSCHFCEAENPSAIRPVSKLTKLRLDWKRGHHPWIKGQHDDIQMNNSASFFSQDGKVFVFVIQIWQSRMLSCAVGKYTKSHRERRGCMLQWTYIFKTWHIALASFIFRLNPVEGTFFENIRLLVKAENSSFPLEPPAIAAAATEDTRKDVWMCERVLSFQGGPTKSASYLHKL